MTTDVKPLTLEDIFGDEKVGSWDIEWLKAIKIPTDSALNKAQALLLMTQTARAIDWCGEKAAILVTLVEKAKDRYKEEWSRALLSRSVGKTAQDKKAEADCDPEYLASKGTYDQLLGYKEFFERKIEGLLNAHYAMREIVKSSYGESVVANWNTTEDAYDRAGTGSSPQRKNEKEEEDDFDL